VYRPLAVHLPQVHIALARNPVSIYHQKDVVKAFQDGGEVGVESYVVSENGDGIEEDGEEESWRFITGANCEAGFIGGAICAERSGFVKFRELAGEVQAVYVVSDADTYISPGTLCREFMLDFAAPSTTVCVHILL
tara:strand:- start:1797 stop:2204 length:408 start_codon:yes stop_codon:yes gene_type:complete